MTRGLVAHRVALLFFPAKPMFDFLPETQKAALTVAVFIATFFARTDGWPPAEAPRRHSPGCAIPTFLPRAGFLCCDLDLRPARRFRNHLVAALILLGSGVVISLIDHYLWDTYFEKRRQIPIPKFIRQVVGLLIFLVALLLVLSFVYHVEGQLRGLVVTSGAGVILVGLATQNLLGGFIAGMSLQISRPYRVGDWLMSASALPK